MNTAVNVPRILRAMKAKGWGIKATCVNVGVNNKTLAKVLDGEVPRRLDALYRILDGLNIPIQEALIGGTHQATKRPGLYLVSDRRVSDS